MNMIRKTSGLTAFMAAGVAIATLAPQAAFAHKPVVRSSVKSSSSVQGDLERRLQMMEDEMRALRAELAKSRSENQATDEKLQAEHQQVQEQMAEHQAKGDSRSSFLFFRGGYAKMSHARNSELLLNNDVTRTLGLSGTFDKKDGEGWYVGAGFDHRLTDDLWGMTDMVSVDGEVMFEYKNFGSSHNTTVDVVLSPVGTTALGGTDAANAASPGTANGVVNIKNQVTQFTLTASPKIKFNNLGIFRPWIIPFGLGIHVISPPSSGVTVLDPGLMVGTGMEINLWKDLWAGFDFRYHFTGNDLAYKYKLPNGTTLLNKTNIDGFTTGAYLGFGF